MARFKNYTMDKAESLETWLGNFEPQTPINRERLHRAYLRNPNTWVCMTCGEFDASTDQTACSDDECTHCGTGNNMVFSVWCIIKAYH